MLYSIPGNHQKDSTLGSSLQLLKQFWAWLEHLSQPPKGGSWQNPNLLDPATGRMLIPATRFLGQVLGPGDRSPWEARHQGDWALRVWVMKSSPPIL